jgi:hypothetical protein
MAGFYHRNRISISRASIIIMLVIIVRTSAEAFYYLEINKVLTDVQQHLYMLGLLVAASSSLVLFLLYLWNKFDLVTALTFLIIIILVGIKVHYAGWHI